MHGQTHAYVILLAIERLILLENLSRLVRLLNNSALNGLPEILERILRLKSLTKSTQLKIGLNFVRL